MRAWRALCFVVVLASASPAALQGGAALLLPVAPGALFGAHVRALDVASGVQVVARSYELRSTRGYETDPPEIDVLEIGPVAGPARLILRLPSRPTALALDAAGATVALALDDRVVVRRTSDGAPVREIGEAGVLGVLVAADGTIAARTDAAVVLFGPDGVERARHAPGGTTTGEMRVYRDHEYGGVYHDTYEIDVPARPAAMAFADDGRLAVSMTDGTVHVIDGASIASRGSAPSDGRGADRATAVALRWTGDAVLGLLGTGALARFAPGGVEVVHDGGCRAAEVDALLEDFPDDRSEWTVSAYCEGAGAGIFSASRLVHVGTAGVRVRRARSGAPIAAFETLDRDAMALDGDDRLVTSNVEGLLRVHALPRGAIVDEEPRVGVAGTVSVFPGRDLVLVSVNPPLPSDTEDERPWTTRGFHLDGSPRPGLDRSGVTIAVARDADRAIVVTHEPFSAELVDLDGAHLATVGVGLPAGEYFAVAVAVDGASAALARDGALYVLDASGARALGTGSVVTELAFDEAASMLAVLRFTAETFTHALEVVDVRSGAVRFSVPAGMEVALSPDGSRLAHHEPGTGEVVVRGTADGREIARLRGEPMGVSGLGLGPDGALYFQRTIDGLCRWLPPAAPEVVGLGALRPDAYRFGAGATVVEDGHFGAHVLRASDRRPVASVHALVSGGFVVVGASGALDGSDDAAGAFLVDGAGTLTRGVDPATMGGARVPGLLARALAGELAAVP